MLRRLLLGFVLVSFAASAAAAGEIERSAFDLLSPVEDVTAASPLPGQAVPAPIALFDGLLEPDTGTGGGGGCASSCSARCGFGSSCSVSCPLGTCAQCSTTCPVTCSCR